MTANYIALPVIAAGLGLGFGLWALGGLQARVGFGLVSRFPSGLRLTRQGGHSGSVHTAAPISRVLAVLMRH